MNGLKNIEIAFFIRFLEHYGLHLQRTKGSHQTWAGKNTNRPIIIQTSVDPIPEFIIKNNIKVLGFTRDEFIAYCNKHLL